MNGINPFAVIMLIGVALTIPTFISIIKANNKKAQDEKEGK